MKTLSRCASIHHTETKSSFLLWWWFYQINVIGKKHLSKRIRYVSWKWAQHLRNLGKWCYCKHLKSKGCMYIQILLFISQKNASCHLDWPNLHWSHCPELFQLTYLFWVSITTSKCSNALLESCKLLDLEAFRERRDRGTHRSHSFSHMRAIWLHSNDDLSKSS